MNLESNMNPSTAEIASSDSTCPIYSYLAADPMLGELVNAFVQEMPDRITALKSRPAAATGAS